MDRDNQQIPGFGFDPGFEPKPLPPVPTPSSSSIFGLISKVNKGILKDPAALTQPGNEAQSNPALQQAQAIAKKLSDIPPQIAKQQAFQNAKTVIENIQRGIWNTPAANQTSSNIDFKVPAVTNVPKPGILISKGQSQSTNVTQGQMYAVSAAKPLVSTPQSQKTGKSLVAYDEDSSKHPGQFTRQEALNEIDRYRVSTRNYNRDQHFAETTKKEEPFKSDFDRYYYGDETQRSEIADRLNRTDLRDNFNIEKDYTPTKVIEPAPRRFNPETGYKAVDKDHPRNDYSCGNGTLERNENDSYQISGNDSYRSVRNENYEASVRRSYPPGESDDEQTVKDRYQRQSFTKDNVTRGYNQMNEGFQRRDNFVPQEKEIALTNRNYDTRVRDSGSYGSNLGNNKQQEKIGNSNAYHEMNRGGNLWAVKESGSSGPWDQSSDRRMGVHDRQSETIPNYGYTAQSQHFQGSDGTIQHSAENMETSMYESDRYRHDKSYRDEGRASDRNIKQYKNKEEQYYRREERDYYSGGNYDREREERYHLNEYEDDIANMEEFPEESEQIDTKSQEGNILYEDFLFGGSEFDKMQVARGSHSDDRRYRDRSDDSRRKGDNFRGDRSRDRGDNHGYLDRSRNASKDRDEGQRTGKGRERRGNEIVERRDEGQGAGKGRESRDNEVVERRDEGLGTGKGRERRGNEVVDRRDEGLGTGKGRERRGNEVVDRQDEGPGTGKGRERRGNEVVDRRDKQQFGTDGRVLPITDDQKAQVIKPVAVEQVSLLLPVPAPVKVPAALVPVTTAILPPGIICKDCNITCMDQDVYNAHLKSDAHILTLQRKAQELFHMETRASRFDVDSAGNPLKAQVLPPTTMITGIPSSTLTSATSDVGIGRNAFTGTRSPGREGRLESPTRFRLRSDSGVQVIPPKPLGPLETRSVHGTWLVLHWRKRHDDEEALIDKYVVEYRNAREIRWVRVGATIKHEFEVNGLQEGTDYLFRVYTTNKEERSEYLESVLITTKKRRDSSERGKRVVGRDRDRGQRSRERGQRSSRERDLRISRERDKKVTRGGTRKTSGDRKSNRDPKSSGDSKSNRDLKSSGVRKTSGDRNSSRDRKQSGSGDKRQSGDKDRKPSTDRAQESKNSGENKDKDGKSGGQTVSRVKSTKTGESEKKRAEETSQECSEAMETDDTQEEVECLLYNEFPNYENEPMLGLDNIYEIRSYLPKTPPRYVCKLCNNKGSHKIIVKHIIGFPHKLNYFKKHNPEVYDMINMIAWKKQQVERANYEARLEEDRLGRGSVRVTLMQNPHDNNGKVVYTDPVPVKAPPPMRQKETGVAPQVYDGDYQSQFDAIYNEAVEKGTLTDTTLIGLNYIKELLHPKMEKEPKYSCSMCSVLCHDTTIVSHLVGKKHRFNYLKAYHEEAYDEIMNTKGNKQQLLIEKIKELAEKDGAGTIKTKVAKNERMWRDKAARAELTQVQGESEGLIKQEEEGNLDKPHPIEPEQFIEDKRSSGGVQAIKFGIKKNDPQPTNVKPINVLEQDQATTKQKEAFDWNKENSLLQSKIQNETIIKSSRKSKFITVYSEFFKRFPVIGLKWVTEFQKQDAKQEPWYLCFMCQQKLQWKSILDHVTSNLHRLNYMKKSDYRQKYNAVYHAIKKDKQSARPLIEQYSKEIAGIEGPPTEIEVMVELHINTEAFKSVAKVQENVKAHSTTASSSQPIQINISATSVSGVNKTAELTSLAVQPSSSEHFHANSDLTSAPAQSHNMAPSMQIGEAVQNMVTNMQTGTTAQQYQGQPSFQSQIRPPPLGAPPIRPPPLHPPPSASVGLNNPIPAPIIRPGSTQRLSAASVSVASLSYQSNSSANISAPAASVGMVRTLAPPVNYVPAASGQFQMMLASQNSSGTNIIQPLMSVPVHRPPPVSVSSQRPPPLLQPSQMGQSFPQTNLTMPVSFQQYPMQGLSRNVPALPGVQATAGNTTVMSAPGQYTSIQSMPPPTVLHGSSNSIGRKPAPWQRQPIALQNQSVENSTPQQAVLPKPQDASASSFNIGNIPQLTSSVQAPTKDQFVNAANIARSREYNYRDNEQYLNRDIGQQQETSFVNYGKNEAIDFKEDEHRMSPVSKSTNFSDSERGVKRNVGELEYHDSNKRPRHNEKLNTYRNEKGFEYPQRSTSRERSGQRYDDRRDLDQRRAGSRDGEYGTADKRYLANRRGDIREQNRGNSRDEDLRREDNRFRGQSRGNSTGRDQRRGDSRDERRNYGSDFRRGDSGDQRSDSREQRSDSREHRSDSTEKRGDRRDERRDSNGDGNQRRVEPRGRGQRIVNTRIERRGGSRDRRRSRSPFRIGKSGSPTGFRQRDDSRRDRNDRYSMESERSLSPRRKALSRDDDILRRDRRELSYPSDEQMPVDDYNIPLDEDKVDDLVRLYSDRVDDNYDNFMGHEGEFDDLVDPRFDGYRDDDDYGRSNQRHRDERGKLRSDFGLINRQDHGYGEDFRYEVETSQRFDGRNFDRYGESNRNDCIEDHSNMYGEFTGINYGRNQSNRDRSDETRAYGSNNKFAIGDSVPSLDRKRNLDNYQQQEQSWQPGGNQGTQHRNEAWKRKSREESKPIEIQGRGFEQDGNRMNYARDIESERQTYRYDDERLFDDVGTPDDILPDPSREEIEALLRRANTMVTPPRNEYNDYEEDDVTGYNMNQAGSSSTYQRGSRGRQGFRGRGPRSGR